MRLVRSTWRAILSSLAWSLLIVSCAPLVTVVAAYMMASRRSDPDPAILVIIAGVTLGPSLVLGISVRRARLVSAHWDFGRVGRNILICASLLTATLLAFCGLYAVARFVEIVWTH